MNHGIHTVHGPLQALEVTHISNEVANARVFNGGKLLGELGLLEFIPAVNHQTLDFGLALEQLTNERLPKRAGAASDHHRGAGGNGGRGTQTVHVPQFSKGIGRALLVVPKARRTKLEQGLRKQQILWGVDVHGFRLGDEQALAPLPRGRGFPPREHACVAVALGKVLRAPVEKLRQGHLNLPRPIHFVGPLNGRIELGDGEDRGHFRAFKNVESLLEMPNFEQYSGCKEQTDRVCLNFQGGNGVFHHRPDMGHVIGQGGGALVGQGAGLLADRENLLVIRRNHDLLKDAAGLRRMNDMGNHGLATDGHQVFAWDALAAPARRNDGHMLHGARLLELPVGRVDWGLRAQR